MKDRKSRSHLDDLPLKHLDRTAEWDWRIPDVNIGSQQRDVAQHLGEGYVGGILTSEIAPQGPHPSPEPICRVPGYLQSAEKLQRRRAFVVGQLPSKHQAAKSVDDVRIDQVGGNQLFVVELDLIITDQ